MHQFKVVILLAALATSGCAVMHPPSEVNNTAHLTPATASTRDLHNLPKPKGKIVAAVYGFRDQTGQYKSAPDSSFSTAVTQGATSMLLKSLKDSGWFFVLERENLQNLLTERKIVRALEVPGQKTQAQIPPLVSASILIEGGVIAYESNVRTGGLGARYLGVGLSTLYRMDQVTINLRTVDMRNGEILHSVSTTKTIYSYEIRPSVFKFVNVKDLFELEAGMTRNEPAQLCVQEAIEAGVAHLIAQGVQAGSWVLNNPEEFTHPILQKYLATQDTHFKTENQPAMSAEDDGAGTIVEPAFKTSESTSRNAQ